ncbi:MAG: putative addiction module antidote protein [Proteobacteria bacterium]|nr:putative addiction module antidote protein [Pseudomonadota bacterium]
MAKKKVPAKRARKVEVYPFDAAEFLDSGEAIAEYLDAAVREPDPDVFLRALENVARVKGMAAIAKKAGVGRESLYKTLAPGAAPRYETVRKLLDAMDVRFGITA